MLNTFRFIAIVTAVFVYAACCEAPSMTCEVRMSQPAGLMLGDSTSVSCEAGETLLGCSVFSEDGNTAGVMPDGNIFVFAF